MPTPQQRAYNAQRQAQGEQPRNEGTWFWRGHASPGYGRIVNDQGTELVAPVSGNTMPAIGQQVLYVPGEPVGQIRLKEVITKRSARAVREKGDFVLELLIGVAIDYSAPNITDTPGSFDASITCTGGPSIISRDLTQLTTPLNAEVVTNANYNLAVEGEGRRMFIRPQQDSVLSSSSFTINGSVSFSVLRPTRDIPEVGEFYASYSIGFQARLIRQSDNQVIDETIIGFSKTQGEGSQTASGTESFTISSTASS